MKQKKQDTTLFRDSINAADAVTSDNSTAPPLFEPEAGGVYQDSSESKALTSQMKKEPFQMKKDEEEERLQMKVDPFQMKVEEEDEKLQMKAEPFQLKVEEEEEKLQMKKSPSASEPSTPESSNLTLLPENVQMKMEAGLNSDFSDVKIHSNSTKAKGLGAQAYAQGNDVHFAPGKYDPESQSGQELLGHELTHVVQQRQGRVAANSSVNGEGINNDKSLESEADKMGSQIISDSSSEGQNNKHDATLHQSGTNQSMQLKAGAPSPVNRKTTLDVFGDGTAANQGLTLNQFSRYFRSQADWFTEPTLSAADRDFLWKVANELNIKPYYIDGMGDIHLNRIRHIPGGSLSAIDAFSRGTSASASTIRIHNVSSYNLDRRIQIGRGILSLESFIPKEVLEATVSESQLIDVIDNSLIAPLAGYFIIFNPTLQYNYDSSSAGGTGPEFTRILDIVRGMTYLTYLSLFGRIKNIHRFTIPTLDRMKHNFGQTSNTLPVQLVITSAHDSTGAFQGDDASLEALAMSTSHLVLILEGANSLGDLTTLIPSITSTYGQPDKNGNKKIAEVMLSGHGGNRSMSLAGAGNATVSDGNVSYGEDSLDLDNNTAASVAFIDTLLNNMDEDSAKVVFNGCLVGSNQVPDNILPADIPAYVAANPSLASYFNQRAQAIHGNSNHVTQAPLASIGTPDSFFDPVSGSLDFQYSSDPHAFGTPEAYVENGREIEGLLHAAVQVAAGDPILANNLLIKRSTKPIADNDDRICVLFANLALNGNARGATIDIGRLNILAHTCGVPSGAMFGVDLVNTWTFIDYVNKHPSIAAEIYTAFETQPFYTNPRRTNKRHMRFMMEQGRLNLGQSRETQTVSFLDTQTGYDTEKMELAFDPVYSGIAGSQFFNSGTPDSDGNIKLALAWMSKNPSDSAVRAYLNRMITVAPGGNPTLSAKIISHLGSLSEIDILTALGRLTPEAPPVSPGGPRRERSNVDTDNDNVNETVVSGSPFKGKIKDSVTALNVREQPNMRDNVIQTLPGGATFNAAGYSGNWVAIDLNGTLGFVHINFIDTLP